ncbi:stress response protein NST1 [Chanos chanos]|uniref:Stress response protein NST1 n=1 Tax=Chanos chanos TaxID=29144 RepID=A0A6J2URS9_CHACN|nr:stress response protein NST1-like [Chanos chanos]
MIGGEESRIKAEEPFDEFVTLARARSAQNRGAHLHRNTSLDAPMKKSSQGEPQLTATTGEQGKGWNITRRNEKEAQRERQRILEEEKEIERQRLAEFQKQKELEKEREKQKEIERQKELERERKKELERERRREMEKRREIEKEMERQKELERKLERERERQRELEKQRELERQKEIERQKAIEKERQKQIEYEKRKSAERELEQQREFERQRQKEFERERERMLDQERLKLREFEKQREQERERERQMELARQREIERQKQLKLEKQRELERQKELERQRELEKQKELERQRELERQKELEKIKEMEREKQRQLERQREQERQKQRELEQQRAMEKRKEAERQRLLELERQRLLELEKKRELEELERMKEIEKQKFYELQLEKQRIKEKEEQEKLKHQQALDRQAMEQHRREAEKEKNSPLRPKVLDLDAVSLGDWAGRSVSQPSPHSPTARWRQPQAAPRPEDTYKPGILDIDSFRSQTQPPASKDLFPVAGFQSVDFGGMDSRTQNQSQPLSYQGFVPPQSLLQPHYQPMLQPQFQLLPFAGQPQTLPQVQFLSQPQTPFQSAPVEWMRTQPQAQLQPQNQPPFQPLIPDRARTQPQSLPQPLAPSRESTRVAWTSDLSFGNSQTTPSWPQAQTDVWGQTKTVEVTVDEPSWLTEMEQPRRPVSTKTGQDQMLTSTLAPIQTPALAPSFSPSMVPMVTPAQAPIQTPAPAAMNILTPERLWTSGPTENSSVGSTVPNRQASVTTGVEHATRGQQGIPWTPNWDVAFQNQKENTTQQQRKEQGQQVRGSAPAETSVDAPLARMRSRSAHRERGRQSWEQVKQCVSGQEEARDTDNLVQETDSQYGTWETGLRTEDSLTPATPSSDGNLTPSPRKPTPPHTPVQVQSTDTPDGSALSPQTQAESLPFLETSAPLLDSSVLRSRAQLSKKNRRAPPSRAARHSAALSLVPEGSGGDAEEWRYRDSTEEKANSSKQEEDSDSEEKTRGGDSRTPTSSSASQSQRVALFPGMDPSALKAQLKKRSDTDNQTDGPAPSSQPTRSPKSPFLPRAARVLPPAGGKENGEESSPQWLKELKSKKRLSQYDNDS